MNILKCIVTTTLLFGCNTTSNQTTSSVQTELSEVRKQVDAINATVNGRLRQIDYFIEHDKCFITYSICLGEGKMQKKACWDRHEQCVISVFRKWKKDK